MKTVKYLIPIIGFAKPDEYNLNWLQQTIPTSKTQKKSEKLKEMKIGDNPLLDILFGVQQKHSKNAIWILIGIVLNL